MKIGKLFGIACTLQALFIIGIPLKGEIVEAIRRELINRK